MFVACGIWCLADVSSVSPSSEHTEVKVCLDIGYTRIKLAKVMGSASNYYQSH